MYQSSIFCVILYTYVYIYIFVERSCMCEEGVLSFLVWMFVYFRQCADREWRELKKNVYVCRNRVRQQKESMYGVSRLNSAMHWKTHLCKIFLILK